MVFIIKSIPDVLDIQFLCISLLVIGTSSVSNVNIIQQLGLRVHGEVVYPDLDSRFYTRTTSFLTKGENLIDRSFYMPLNLYNKNSKNST